MQGMGSGFIGIEMSERKESKEKAAGTWSGNVFLEQEEMMEEN